MNKSELDKLSNQIIGAAIEVHKLLGPGLLEHVYQEALMCELKIRGLFAQSEVELPVVYKGNRLQTVYKADIIVADQIIIELKSTENFSPLHAKQLLTYLKVSDKPLGLLINFNNEKLSDGLKRLINTKVTDGA